MLCSMYLAVALFFITNLFSLYRLSEPASPGQAHSFADWWPSALGGKASYAFAWTLTLLIGLASHHLDLFSLRRRWESKDPTNTFDWERKSRPRCRPFLLADT